MDARTPIFDPLKDLRQVFGADTARVLDAAVALGHIVAQYREVLLSQFPSGIRLAGIELLPEAREKFIVIETSELARRNAEKVMRETAIAQLFPRKPSFPTVDLGAPVCVDATCKFEPEGCDCSRAQ